MSTLVIHRKLVMVFRTSVLGPLHVDQLKDALNQLITPPGRWNFDLEDCDKILRIEHDEMIELQLIELLNQFGFECEVLED